MTARSNLYLVRKIAVESIHYSPCESRATGLVPRSRFADGLFLALALSGSLAIWWSVW